MMAPAFNSLARTVHGEWQGAKVADVNCDAHPELGNRFQITGYPTLAFVHKVRKCVYMHMLVCLCVYPRTQHTRAIAHTNTRTQTHMHTQTHTRTQTHIQARKHGAANTQGKVLDMYHGPHSQQAMFDFIKEAASFRRVRVCVCACVRA